MTKRILHTLHISKIAAVDFPCQEPAQVAIIKARNYGAMVAKAISDAITKAGITLEGDADQSTAAVFDAVLAEQQLTQAFWDTFYKATDALRTVLLSILNDDAVTDKQPLVAESLKEFADYIGEILPGSVGKALAAGVAAVFAGVAGPTDQGDTMSALTKALGLEDNASEAVILKALQDRDALSAARVEKMTDEHVLYMAKMAPADRDGFQKMSAADRDKKMKAEPKSDNDEDDVKKALADGTAFKAVDGGHIILKAKVGADTFAMLKSVNDGRIADRVEFEKRKETETATQFVTMAKDNGFAIEFAPTLRKALQGGDPAARDALFKEISALRAQAESAGLFKEMGGTGAAAAGTAEAEALAKAAEVKKAHPTISDQQAFAKVWKDPANADLRKRYNAERSNN